MAVLVTRPHPDDEATASALRAKGFEVMLAPMLRFEPVAFHDDEDARYGAVIVTSANALRGIAPHLQDSRLQGSRLLKLPLFAVGEHTASAAHRAGFDNVIPASETDWLASEIPSSLLKAKVLSPAMIHVDPSKKISAKEQFDLVHYIAGILEEAYKQ